MIRARLGIALVATVLLTAAAPAAETLAVGNWKLSYQSGATSRISLWLLEVKDQDGKQVGTVSGALPTQKGATVKEFRVQDGQVRLAIQGPAGLSVFEGKLAKDGKKVLGSFREGERLYAAELEPTELKALAQRDIVQRVEIPELQEVTALTSRPLLLRAQAARAKEAEQKEKLLKDAADAARAAAVELPKLYQQVADKHADSPAVFAAALELLKNAEKSGYPADQVKTWADAADQTAARYGPQWQGHFEGQLAEALVRQKPFAELALDYARRAEQNLGAKAPAAVRVKVLDTLVKALAKNGQEDAAKPVRAELAKLEKAIDDDYKAKVPPFKPTPFVGRKGDSNRAVVLELFTGAECPPCVAADVAFDALQQAYPPRDLILIQYHLHIPGPDPMTNPAAEARWAYYRDAFGAMEVRGTPTTVFNGKPQAGGGGGMAAAENKFQQYRTIIDPLLEQKAPVELKVQAHRRNGRIEVRAEVANLSDPGADKKLRLLLVEETVRYVGGNGLRFHHQVVRAMPGGAAGKALEEPAGRHAAAVELEALRKDLTAYLDKYEADVRPFPRPDRPLDLKNLRVIALVQDDKTHEILQAAQADITDLEN